MRKFRYLFAFASLGAFAAVAPAAILHDEAVHGDLSGDRLNPSSYVLALGSNSIIASSVSGDREYVTLNVPAGLSLSSLVLSAYEGDDQTAFIAVQNGTQLTEPPSGADVANLLGWTHFGPGAGLPPPEDVLDELGSGAGAIGFSGALPAGDYTFWMQQTGGAVATYRFDFVTTPEPASAMVLALAALLRRR